MKRNTLLAFALITTAGAASLGALAEAPAIRHRLRGRNTDSPRWGCRCLRSRGPTAARAVMVKAFATAMNCFARPWPAIIRRKVCRN